MRALYSWRHQKRPPVRGIVERPGSRLGVTKRVFDHPSVMHQQPGVGHRRQLRVVRDEHAFTRVTQLLTLGAKLVAQGFVCLREVFADLFQFGFLVLS